MRAPTAEDLQVIAGQIGRHPEGVLGIARSCSYGYPQVVMSHPLHRHGETFVVFPTLFWLSCPFLVEEVSRLETEGGVNRYEEILAQDPELARSYARAHEAYRQERLALLSSEDWEFLREKGAVNRMATGIAGLGNPMRVKCLHAQLAHFLARGENPIGERVARELPALECPPERVVCRALC